MKKLLATILALVMALGLCTSAWAEEGDWTGSGTKADPFVITTETGLKKLATDVNNSTVYSDTYFKLGASITVTDWTPIGQKGTEKKFAGTFDGNGQTVTINRIKSDLDPAFGGYAGFFGAVKGATIKNLTVDGTISGADVAGIVARMDGGTVENCVNKATVTGTRKAAGIVVITKDSGEATIQNCRNHGTIKSTGDRAGGIINLIELKTQVLNCTNSGSVTSEATATYGAGGIVAWTSCAAFTISECVNTADVTAKGAAGGIVGGVGGDKTEDRTGTISGCKNSAGVEVVAGANNSNMDAGGIVGWVAIESGAKRVALTAAGNANTGVVSGANRLVIAEDVTLGGSEHESYPHLYIEAGANVVINGGNIGNETQNRGSLTITGDAKPSAALTNYGKLVLNCNMEAGKFVLVQNSETLIKGGTYKFTIEENERNGLKIEAGTFKDLRKNGGNTVWGETDINQYLVPGAEVAYDGTGNIKVWTVTMPVSGVALDKTSAELQVGKTLTLTATVTPDNATDKAVAWNSSNAAVATVDANGIVTAKAEGTATITATADGKTATCTVTVKAAPRYYYNSTTTTDTKKDEGKTSPKTFDAGVGIYAVTAVLSVTGMAWTAKKRED